MDTRKLWFQFLDGEKVVIVLPQGMFALDKLRGKLNKIHAATNWDSYRQTVRKLS
jgi:hypothetical protein